VGSNREFVVKRTDFHHKKPAIHKKKPNFSQKYGNKCLDFNKFKMVDTPNLGKYYFETKLLDIYYSLDSYVVISTNSATIE
jgi:hypothetical protein